MVCPKCGASNSVGADFCADCGQRLDAMPETGTVQEPVIVPPAGDGPTPPPGAPYPGQPAPPPGAPYPGQPAPPPGAPYPGQPVPPPGAPYPGQPTPPPGAPYPGQPAPPPGVPYPGQGQYPPPPGAPYPGQVPPGGYNGQIPPGYEQKSKLAAGLLGIFLGGFGAGRFYLGYTNLGVGQLLTSLLCGAGAIWGFIDGIMILTGSVATDANGVPLKD